MVNEEEIDDTRSCEWMGRVCSQTKLCFLKGPRSGRADL